MGGVAKGKGVLCTHFALSILIFARTSFSLYDCSVCICSTNIKARQLERFSLNGYVVYGSLY